MRWVGLAPPKSEINWKSGHKHLSEGTKCVGSRYNGTLLFYCLKNKQNLYISNVNFKCIKCIIFHLYIQEKYISYRFLIPKGLPGPGFPGHRFHRFIQIYTIIHRF